MHTTFRLSYPPTYTPFSRSFAKKKGIIMGCLSFLIEIGRESDPKGTKLSVEYFNIEVFV